MTTATLLVMFLVTYSSETQDIHTVSKISVQKHQTIIIPCLYDQKYVGNPKYVSSGGIWLFSASVTHDRMSVVDKQTEKVFTATLRNAEVSDTGTYWCGISKSGYDPAGKLKLEVLESKARLHVSSQSVSGYEGGSAVVVCHGASQWCQIGRSCVGSSGGTSDKTVVHISGDALNVTLSELKREDSGWYFCSDGESQMPVHITVKKAPYTRRVTVQNARQTPESGQDEPMGQKRVLWLVVLGVMLFIITCAAVILVKANYKRKQTAETSNPCEGMNNQELRKENEENEEDTCDKLYENTSGMKQNIQEKEKNDKVACENLYEKTGIKQNIQEKEEDTCDKLYEIMSEIKQNNQENKENEEVACDKLYEIMSGMKQNIQGNEKNCEVENLYEIMTGIEQNMQTALDNKNIYESMVRKVK